MKRWTIGIILLAVAAAIYVSFIPFLYQRTQIALEKERPHFEEQMQRWKKSIEKDKR